MNSKSENHNSNNLSEAFGYQSSWKENLTEKEFLQYIEETTIAKKPKEMRQYVALYLLENNCSSVIVTFLEDFLRKTEEELFFYSLVNDNSFRRNCLVVKPDIDVISTVYKDNHTNFMHVNISSMSWKTNKVNKPLSSSWKNRFLDKIINPLLDELSISLKEKNESKATLIKNKLSMFY